MMYHTTLIDFSTTFSTFQVVDEGVKNAADLSGLVDFLLELGGKHARYGTQTQHFPVSQK